MDILFGYQARSAHFFHFHSLLASFLFLHYNTAFFFLFLILNCLMAEKREETLFNMKKMEREKNTTEMKKERKKTQTAC